MDDDEWLFRSVLEYDTLEVFSLQSATRLLTLAGDAETLFIASFNSDGENVKSEIQRLCLPSCKIDETLDEKDIAVTGGAFCDRQIHSMCFLDNLNILLCAGFPSAESVDIWFTGCGDLTLFEKTGVMTSPNQFDRVVSVTSSGTISISGCAEGNIWMQDLSVVATCGTLVTNVDCCTAVQLFTPHTLAIHTPACISCLDLRTERRPVWRSVDSGGRACCGDVSQHGYSAIRVCADGTARVFDLRGGGDSFVNQHLELSETPDSVKLSGDGRSCCLAAGSAVDIFHISGDSLSKYFSHSGHQEKVTSVVWREGGGQRQVVSADDGAELHVWQPVAK